MWTRSLLKDNAKRILHVRYWRCLVACLIAALLGALTTPIPSLAMKLSAAVSAPHGFSFHYSVDPFMGRYMTPDPFALYAPAFMAVSAVVAVIALIGSAAAICVNVFLSSPVKVGLARYMMENRMGDSPLDTLFSVFRAPYLNVVKGMFLRNLRIFGWSLLFVIPGIYKSLQYSMVPYLLAENPYLTPARARELSRAMTEGEKMNIFVLGLSFIGWKLLAAIAGGAVTLGLFPAAGEIFLNPYVESTYAELYAALRAKAFSMGITDEHELAGFVRH